MQYNFLHPSQEIKTVSSPLAGESEFLHLNKFIQNVSLINLFVSFFAVIRFLGFGLSVFLLFRRLAVFLCVMVILFVVVGNFCLGVFCGFLSF